MVHLVILFSLELHQTMLHGNQIARHSLMRLLSSGNLPLIAGRARIWTQTLKRKLRAYMSNPQTKKMICFKVEYSLSPKLWISFGVVIFA